MPAIVIIDHDVQPVARTQSQFVRHRAVGEHPLDQLPAAQVSDEFAAVVAVETGPAVIPDVQAYPGAPTQRIA